MSEIREPLSVNEHRCPMPTPPPFANQKGGRPLGTYFECECGRDYVLRAGDYGAGWVSVHFWNRRKIRRSVGIDEHCPECGVRAHRQYRRDIKAQSRAGGPVVVGYTCDRHSYENWSPERKAAFQMQTRGMFKGLLP